MQSDMINELGAALAKAQSVITGAKQDKANPYFKSKYADLSSVWDACRKALTEQGLSVVQTTKMTDRGLVLVTTLVHSSGQWIAGEMPVLSAKQDAQSMGSALTYARRYALAAIAGVAPDDDDDGQEATRPTNVKPNPQPIQAKSNVISEKQVKLLYAKLNGHEDLKAKVEERLEAQGIESYKDIPVAMFDKILKFVEDSCNS